MTINNIISEEEFPSDQPLISDVCIVGSGAAGCVLAYELAKEGKSVILLEKGGHYPIQWIKDRERNEGELTNLWKNKQITLSQNYSVQISQGQCVGGSTMINYGICFEIPDDVFSYWKNAFGITITKEELDKAYKKVGEQIHVRKINLKHAGKPHEKIKKGCDLLGYTGDWMDKSYLYCPQDESRTREQIEAGDCMDNSHIHGSVKQSAYIAYLSKANFDNIKLYTNCTVNEILVKRNKAFGVVGVFKNSKGIAQKLTVHAKHVIISAGPIASSEILLQNNLSNGNDQVGKHLSIHPSASVVGEFDETLQGDKDFAMAYYCDQFSVRKLGKPGFMIESVCIPPSNYSIITPSFGDENKKHVEKYTNSAMVGVLVHDEPSGTVRLNWSGDAIVDYSLSDTDQKKMIDGIKEAIRILLRAGARKVITGHIQQTEIRNIGDLRIIDQRGAGFAALFMLSAHPQGGNRMGEDKSVSVVDSHCKSHEISNLYICDASVFPTSLGVNPQYTVMALATITADYINKQ